MHTSNANDYSIERCGGCHYYLQYKALNHACQKHSQKKFCPKCAYDPKVNLRLCEKCNFKVQKIQLQRPQIKQQSNRKTTQIQKPHQQQSRRTEKIQVRHGTGVLQKDSYLQIYKSIDKHNPQTQSRYINNNQSLLNQKISDSRNQFKSSSKTQIQKTYQNPQVKTASNYLSSFDNRQKQHPQKQQRQYLHKQTESPKKDQNQFLDVRCRQSFSYYQIAKILDRSNNVNNNKNISVLLPCNKCQVRRQQLKYLIMHKCLICGKDQEKINQQSKIILKDNLICCLGQILSFQSRIKYPSPYSKPLTQIQRQLYQYICSKIYQCQSCQRNLRYQDDFSQIPLGEQNQLVLCKFCYNQNQSLFGAVERKKQEKKKEKQREEKRKKEEEIQRIQRQRKWEQERIERQRQRQRKWEEDRRERERIRKEEERKQNEERQKKNQEEKRNRQRQQIFKLNNFSKKQTPQPQINKRTAIYQHQLQSEFQKCTNCDQQKHISQLQKYQQLGGMLICRMCRTRNQYHYRNSQKIKKINEYSQRQTYNNKITQLNYDQRQRYTQKVVSNRKQNNSYLNINREDELKLPKSKLQLLKKQQNNKISKQSILKKEKQEIKINGRTVPEIKVDFQHMNRQDNFEQIINSRNQIKQNVKIEVQKQKQKQIVKIKVQKQNQNQKQKYKSKQKQIVPKSPHCNPIIIIKQVEPKIVKDKQQQLPSPQRIQPSAQRIIKQSQRLIPQVSCLSCMRRLTLKQQIGSPSSSQLIICRSCFSKQSNQSQFKKVIGVYDKYRVDKQKQQRRKERQRRKQQELLESKDLIKILTDSMIQYNQENIQYEEKSNVIRDGKYIGYEEDDTIMNNLSKYNYDNSNIVKSRLVYEGKQKQQQNAQISGNILNQEIMFDDTDQLQSLVGSQIEGGQQFQDFRNVLSNNQFNSKLRTNGFQNLIKRQYNNQEEFLNQNIGQSIIQLSQRQDKKINVADQKEIKELLDQWNNYEKTIKIQENNKRIQYEENIKRQNQKQRLKQLQKRKQKQIERLRLQQIQRKKQQKRLKQIEQQKQRLKQLQRQKQIQKEKELQNLKLQERQTLRLKQIQKQRQRQRQNLIRKQQQKQRQTLRLIQIQKQRQKKETAKKFNNYIDNKQKIQQPILIKMIPNINKQHQKQAKNQIKKQYNDFQILKEIQLQIQLQPSQSLIRCQKCRYYLNKFNIFIINSSNYCHRCYSKQSLQSISKIPEQQLSKSAIRGQSVSKLSKQSQNYNDLLYSERNLKPSGIKSGKIQRINYSKQKQKQKVNDRLTLNVNENANNKKVSNKILSSPFNEILSQPVNQYYAQSKVPITKNSQFLLNKIQQKLGGSYLPNEKTLMRQFKKNQIVVQKYKQKQQKKEQIQQYDSQYVSKSHAVSNKDYRPKQQLSKNEDSSIDALNMTDDLRFKKQDYTKKTMLVCSKCGNQVTFLCFSKYCLDCFKKSS